MSHAVEQVRIHGRWRALIDTFLKELLEASQCDYAAFVDMRSDREPPTRQRRYAGGARYGFATRSDPLPDIDWKNVVNHLWLVQQSKPEYIVVGGEDVATGHESPLHDALGKHFQTGLFDVVVSLPLTGDAEPDAGKPHEPGELGRGALLQGSVSLFGTAPPADPEALRGPLRPRLEGLARITAHALAAMSAGTERMPHKAMAQEALRELPEGLLMADSRGVVIEANEAFSALTGIPSDILIGRDLRERTILDTDCDFLVARLLESGQPFEIVARIGGERTETESVLTDKDYSREGKFIRLRGTAYPAGSDPPEGMILLADDVTAEVLSRRETTRRERRHTQEIELASRLQQKFFPDTFQKKRIRVATRLMAAEELAGDFFDTFDLGPNTIAVVIGDVVGKGIPSSLMAMSVHGMIANQATALNPPKRVLERVNGSLYHHVRGDYWYSTCFYAKIHVTQLRVTYAHAGHELPLWWHADTNEITFLEGEGLPLGIFADNRYSTLQIVLGEGDKLLLYSDGLTDAINPAGERFGHDRLVELFQKNANLGAKNLLRKIENTIVEFRAGREQMDDVALALICVVPDSWTTVTIPPYSFQEILEGVLGELSLKGVDEDTMFKVRLALDECVTNAYRHGHRGDERMPIRVSYIIESDRLTMKVRDTGQGFDFGLIPDPTLDENLMIPTGRGVFITLKMMDEVAFNDVGNEITVIKYLHGTENSR